MSTYINSQLNLYQLTIQSQSQLAVGTFLCLSIQIYSMDLSILPDDQLLQLIEAVTKEVARRAIAIQTATNKYWQEAKEEILDNINDSQSPIDDACTKATVVRLLKNLDFFRAYKYDSFSLSIWEKNGDIRLYLQQSFKNNGWKFTYYHTGNPWKFKASIEAPDLDPSGISGFRNFGRLICDELPVKFKCFSTHDAKNQIDTQLLQRYQSKL